MENKVTNIQITPLRPQNGHIGFANFIYDQAFYFSSIGIYTRPEGGYRLTYPSRKSQTHTFSIFHPLNKEVASAIENAIISKYEAITSCKTQRS